MTAEGAEDTGGVAVGPVEENDAGEAVAGVVAGSVSGGALMGADAVVGAVGGADAHVGAVGGAEAAAAPEVGEGASGLGDQLNAGCDAGDCGKHAAGWPLWMPPFSYAKKRLCVSSVK